MIDSAIETEYDPRRGVMSYKVGLAHCGGSTQGGVQRSEGIGYIMPPEVQARRPHHLARADSHEARVEADKPEHALR